jgi:HK97 gp10 family phage protein
MNSSLKLEGVDEAIRMLNQLDDKVQHKTLVKVMRKAGSPIMKTARSIVRPISKRVAASVKVWDFKKAEHPNVFVGPRYSKDPAKDPWFAHLIEGGTKGVKKNNVTRSKAFSTNSENIKIRAIVKNTAQGGRFRGNQPARPFMEPAIMQNREKVNKILTEDIGSLIEKTLKK